MPGEFFFHLERHVMPHDAERNVSNSPEAIFYLDLFFLVFFFNNFFLQCLCH